MSEHRPEPSVSFVILNWNQCSLTVDCLQSLRRLAYSNYHIYVVDNGSTDDSAETIRRQFPEVELIENGRNVGYSEGNNVGIRRALAAPAKPDYVFLLNNDTLVGPAMLSSLVQAAHADSTIGIAGPTMYYAEPAEGIWSGASRIDWHRAALIRDDVKRHADTAREVAFVDTCAMLIRREALERVGMLNTDYFINFDDLDLNLRVRHAGFKVMYVPQARMWHRVSAAMGLGSPATTYYMTRNALLFFSSHAPGIWKLVAPAEIVLRTLRTVLAWSVKPKYRGEEFRRKRAANMLALRDFGLRRFGRMGADVARICYR